MSPRVVSSRPGSVLLAYFSAAATTLSQVLVDFRTQVSMMLAKPTSLPPIAMLTSVVDALSDESWLFL